VEWSSQWSHMQLYVGWALLFASVTCLQEYIRWDPFILGAQPLDMSPLSLCQHNKALLPAKLPQCPLSQLEIPTTFLGNSLPGLWRWWFVTSLVARRRSHQAPTDSLIQRGIHPHGKLGWRPHMHNGTQWGAGTSEGRGAVPVRLVRIQVWIQAYLRSQKGRPINSQRPLVTAFWGETVSLRLREWGKSV
jgi:hypothetical protein